MVFVLGVVQAGCEAGEQDDLITTVRGALAGDVIRTVNMPSTIDCSTTFNGQFFPHWAISAAVVPGATVGHAEFPSLLATSCTFTNAQNLYFLNPGGSDTSVTDFTPPSVTATLVINQGGVPFAPPQGFGSFAFRGDVSPPDLIACSNPAVGNPQEPHKIWRIDLATGAATFMFNAAFPTEENQPGGTVRFSFCDGLAWDAAEDTVYMSPDKSPTVFRYQANGTPLPTLNVPSGCFSMSGPTITSGNSGLVVVGDQVLMACNGGTQWFHVNKTTGAVVQNLQNPVQRSEDLELDQITFGTNRGVVWMKDAFFPKLVAVETPFVPARCDDTDQSGCLVNMLLVPMCWTETQAAFDAEVATRKDFLIQAAGLSTCAQRVRVITVPQPANGALANRCNSCDSGGLRSAIAADGLFTLDQLNAFQIVGGLIRNRAAACGTTAGSTDGIATFWGALNVNPLTDAEKALGLELHPETIAAHEWGHTRGLGEEYCSVARGASTLTSCSGAGDPNTLRADLGCDESVVSNDCCFEAYRAPSTGPAPDPNFPCGGSPQPLRCCRGNKNDLNGRCVMSHATATGPRKFCAACLSHMASGGVSCASGFANTMPVWGAILRINEQGQFFIVDAASGQGPPSQAINHGPFSVVLAVPGGGPQIAVRPFGLRDSIRDHAPDDFTPTTVEVGLRIPLPPEIAANQPVRFSVRNDAGQELSSGTLNGRPPIANAGPDATFSCNAPHAGSIMVNGGLSSDPDGDSLRFSWTSPTVTLATPNASTSAGTAPLGTSTVSLTVSDGFFTSAPDTVQVTVVDTTPPVVTAPPAVTTAICGSSAPVQVGQATATDVCRPEAVTITGQVISKNGATLSPPLNVVGGLVTLEVGTYVIRWTASDGSNTAQASQTVTVGTTIQSSGSFIVEDRGVVRTVSNAGAAIYNSGSGTTRLGNDGRSGAIASVGPVSVLHRAVVEGNVRSATSVFRETDAVISGTVTVGPVALPAIPALPSFTVPGGAGTVVNGTLNLPPGSYASITANSGATLILSGGDYFFGGFTINSNVTLRATATTRVFVQSTLVLRSPFRNTGGQLQPVFLGFAGTATTLEASMEGTLLAPAATVTFGISPNLTFTGSFRARHILLRPSNTLVCR